MKKLCVILSLFVAAFLFCGSTFVINPFGTFGGGGGGDCADLGSDAFAYDMDHSSGTNYACIQAGTTTSTASTGTIVACSSDPGSCGTDGGNVYKFVSSGEQVNFGPSYINTSEDVSTFEIYLTGTTGDNYTIKAKVDNSNQIYAIVRSDNTVRLFHYGSGTAVDIISTYTIPDTTWTTVQLGWSVTNNKIGIKIGANPWEYDSDPDTVTAFTGSLTALEFEASVVSDTFYIDNWRMKNTGTF